jgi:outer membrane receptor protein involved in Fe transport
VTSVGGQEFFETGSVSVGDTLNELPALRSTFSQANSTRFLGTAGLNLLDLRGMGTVRTLVLQNGRRHVGGDVLSSAVTPDTNTIPTDLIERVDVVTGANSAVYGSDAIAGVVNFILKDDFEGLQLRGQGGISKYEDGGSYFIAGLWGTNFGDGRGNVAINAEYAHQDFAWGDDRNWIEKAWVQDDSDPGGSVNGSDGNPDRILIDDFRSTTSSPYGYIRFAPTAAAGPVCGADPLGARYSCMFQFNPDGTLAPVIGQRVGTGQGAWIGGNGASNVENHAISFLPKLDRYNLNLIGHYELSPALVPFVEAKWSHTDSDSINFGGSSPAFMSGTTSADPFQYFGPAGSARNRELIRLDNPYMTPQARATICAARVTAGLTACTNATTIAVGERFYGLAPRQEKASRDTYRIVGGIRGDIGGPWNYEVSVNYGRLKEKTEVLGNLNRQRFLLGIDAVTDPATGNIVCRSQIDPNAAFGFYPWVYGVLDIDGGLVPGDPNGAARLQQDIDACVPFNVMGGQFTDAQRDYLLVDTTSTGKISQFDVMGFISGDTSGLFELPGGPIGIVLGAEYRADNLRNDQEEIVNLAYTFYNAIPSFSAPKSKVKEVFGEIRLPIVKDLPFMRELELSAAGRISDYSVGNTGTVKAWNASAVWSPVEGVRLRGNIGRSVRAPNQVELFTPFGQNFALITDPCDADSVGAGANRPANCLAAGVPAGTQIDYLSSLGFKSGGNAGLEAEKSDSITLGAVLTPTFLPGFSFSADYYNIKLKDAINPLTAQVIINSCYDSPDINNPFCASFSRAGPTGQGGNNGLPYGIVTNSLLASPFNFASIKARGLDIEAAYRRTIPGLGRLDTRLNYTHVFELTNFTDPTDPSFGDRQLLEVGDPEDAFNWSTSLQHGRFTMGYQMRYIGKQVVTTPASFE